MLRRSHPRSPVQSVRPPSLLPLLLLALAAPAYWGWQQRDQLLDWYDGEVPDPSKGPRQPHAELFRIFSTDDYPLDAIRNEEHGTTGFRVEISRRGHVTECVVTSSSGSEALDEATCDIVKSRARYEPARDAQGRRTAGHDTGRIRWELPEE